jgi:hypothetical protein
MAGGENETEQWEKSLLSMGITGSGACMSTLAGGSWRWRCCSTFRPQRANTLWIQKVALGVAILALAA